MNENITNDLRIRKEARKRFVYQHLSKRQFACPKGYRSFDDVITIMSIDLELAELGVDISNYQWLWIAAIDIMSRAAVENIFPVYRVDRDLMELFLDAEDPKPFNKTLPVPFESGLFLFPKGMIRFDRWEIDWLLVDIVERGDETIQTFNFTKQPVSFNRMGHNESLTYRWVTQPESGDRLSPGDLFVSTFGYSQNRDECAPNIIGTATDRGFEVTKFLNCLVKNLLLWLHQPRECEYQVIEVTKARGFGKTANAKPVPKAVYPIKLGLEEQPHKIYRYPNDDRSRDPSLPPRKSPRPHVRRSHWRNVPVGPRETHKRELRLILKTKVNAPKD
jgi:hypothetical protein